MRPYFILILSLFIACRSEDSTFSDKNTLDKFEDHSDIHLPDYWYEGQAQILTFNLTQNRYNNEHPGEAILIQVTEDFNTDLQVKSDGVSPESNTTPVIKTNLIERFTTGVYDYSMMTSTFTGVEFPCPTYKVTHSSQDWCGQSLVQINKQANQFQHRLFSYFESEGDQVKHLPQVWLEDEIFNLIRIAPDKIKSGQVLMLPSSKIQRLLHLPTQEVETTIHLESSRDTSRLSLSMPSLKREKTISFLSKPPYTITGWEDIYPSAFDQKLRRTKAYLKSVNKLAYWELNGAENINLREELGLRLY